MKEKATMRIKRYINKDGPTVSVVSNHIIEKDGCIYRDDQGDGKLTIYKDWHHDPQERAEDLVKQLSVEEKIGQLFLNSWKMGIEQEEEYRDETGLLDEKTVEKGSSIFGVNYQPGTTEMMKSNHVRHFILRSNPKPDELADWINEMNGLAEEDEHFIPVEIISNSRNENGEVVFGMNEATGVFATYPGTLGIAAAIKGTSIDVIDNFADCIRHSWDSTGMKKGYMYMADTMTDPRWQRTYGTFGEDTELITEIFDHLIPGVQGSDHGVTSDGVALTTKHFPGGGARENGFDPHYQQGQWNVYATEGSLQKYHLPPFVHAVKHHTASIMPYYAKPAKAKSAEQCDMNGNPIEWEARGFAYNHMFIDTILRNQLGFDGYVNSDSGITQMMSWGVEDLEICERVGLGVYTGVDIISGSYDLKDAKEAYDRHYNGYYDTHPVPEGYTVDQITLSDELLDRAVTRTLKEMFALGIYDNPYRDPQKAVETVQTKKYWDDAWQAHLNSVVLLKNQDVLPLTKDKLANKKVYAACFHQQEQQSIQATEELKNMMGQYEAALTDNPDEADYAILFVVPKSGAYFSATKGYLELDICDGKETVNVNPDGTPSKETHMETTLHDVAKIREIYETVHSHGGKVISNINFTLAWEVGNVEQYSDALLAGFDTYVQATLEVIFGHHTPVGRMPITLPRNDDVIKVAEDGSCISPNDVPGYDKDQYMPESMKDENGKAYAYKDSEGNYYELNFGLTY